MSDDTADPHEAQNRELEQQVKKMPEVPDRSTMSSIKLPGEYKNKKMSPQSKTTLVLAISVILLAALCVVVFFMIHDSPVKS